MQKPLLLLLLQIAAVAAFTPSLSVFSTTPSIGITGPWFQAFPTTRQTKLHPYRSSIVALKRQIQDGNFPDDVDEDNDEAMEVRGPKLDSLVETVSFRLKRVSWLSWWSQVILTTVASVTLLFTRNVVSLQATGVAVNRNLFPNYFLAGSSITLGFVSIFWTWATRRLSRRLLRKPATRIQAANMIRKDIHVGTIVNLLGMALALIGAEQIVGGLAIKVLTTTASTPAVYQGAQSLSLLQPLDILVVQANTNTLFSHFCSLVAYLWLGLSIDKLDPPSKDDSSRR